MAGADEGRPVSGLLEERRERLQDTAMVLVRPEVRRVQEKVIARNQGQFAGRDIAGGCPPVLLLECRANQKDVLTVSAFLRTQCLTSILRDGADCPRASQGLRESPPTRAQHLRPEKLREELVLNVGN